MAAEGSHIGFMFLACPLPHPHPGRWIRYWIYTVNEPNVQNSEMNMNSRKQYDSKIYIECQVLQMWGYLIN